MLRVSLLIVLVLAAAATAANERGVPPVVLLHGLNRTSLSMSDLAGALTAAGRPVVNVD